MLVMVGVVRDMVVTSTIAQTTPTNIHKPITRIVSHLMVIFTVVIHHCHSIMPEYVIRPPAVVSVWQLASGTKSHYHIHSVTPFHFILGNFHYYLILSLRVSVTFRLKPTG